VSLSEEEIITHREIKNVVAQSKDLARRGAKADFFKSRRGVLGKPRHINP
jgi:hypothetical protein